MNWKPEERIRMLENRVAALQKEANYYRRRELAEARERNLHHWLMVFKHRWERQRRYA